jgi:hypothetical protein
MRVIMAATGSKGAPATADRFAAAVASGRRS